MTIEELQEANAAAFAAIAEAGYGIDPVQVLKLRLDIITDVLISTGVIDGDALEIEWETNLGELFSVIGAEIRTAQLTEP